MEQQYGYQQPVYQPPYAPPTNTLAIISLIASIGGLTFLPTVGSIAGLIMGYIARRQIAESRGTMGGSGLATAGIVIGWIGIIVALLAVCLSILIFVVLPLLGFGGLTACAALGNTTY